jgi:predicted cupin superfamily sugar epimerase
MQFSAEYWINKLHLEKHPEGGYFKETYRSQDEFRPSEKYTGRRSYYTAIYYLITKDSPSKFHKVLSDEIWHFYAGDNAVINFFDEKNKLNQIELGLIDANPQFLIKGGYEQAVYTTGDYSLMGCTVSPGFDFDDFDMCNRDEMIRKYPENKNLIEKLT